MKHTRNARNMLFMFVTKLSSRHILTETMANTSDNNRSFNSRKKEIVYSVLQYILKNKEDCRTPYLEGTAEATGVS